jgi:hypothetical protein
MTRGGMDGCPAVALDLQFHPLHVRPDASALIVYVTLSLSAVWQRRLLKLLTAEAAQGILRFTEPLLPAEYLTNTRVAAAFCGADLGHYGNLPTAFWYGHPINATSCGSPCDQPPGRTLHRSAILDALVAMV